MIGVNMAWLMSVFSLVLCIVGKALGDDDGGSGNGKVHVVTVGKVRTEQFVGESLRLTCFVDSHLMPLSPTTSKRMSATSFRSNSSLRTIR